jgi:hypothetical protein
MTEQHPVSDTIHIRLDPQLRSAIEQVAAEQERSLSGQIRFWLNSMVEARRPVEQRERVA